MVVAASFNVFKYLTDFQKWDDLGDFFRFDSDLSVVGLQEINFHFEPPEGWKIFQPRDFSAGKDPVLWRVDTWRLLHKDSVLLSNRIETLEHVWPARYGNCVVLEKRYVAGQRLIHINAHLNADIGDDREQPGLPNGTVQQKEHLRGLHRIIRLANNLYSEYKCPVIFTGDLNVDYSMDKLQQHPEFPYVNFTAAGFHSVWELGEQSTRTAKPLTGRTIDYGYGRHVHWIDVRTPDTWGPDDPIESDHLPVYMRFRPQYFRALLGIFL